MLRLDGTEVAKARQIKLQDKITQLKARHGLSPGLAVILVGEDPASQVYVRNKVKTCSSMGMNSWLYEQPKTLSEADLIKEIQALNARADVHGILVQLPLPKHIQAERALESIQPQKDPDGLTFENLGMLWAGHKRVAPCTPAGVMAILAHYQISVRGKNAVVVGRSNIVGKPMAQLLLDADATVTICHSRTPDLAAHTREADLVVVAAGRERFLGKDDFRKDAVVIDVGMHRPSQGPFAGKLCGDIRFEELEGWASAATPVPKGVGPMTIQMLMENTVTLAELSATKNK